PQVLAGGAVHGHVLGPAAAVVAAVLLDDQDGALAAGTGGGAVAGTRLVVPDVLAGGEADARDGRAGGGDGDRAVEEGVALLGAGGAGGGDVPQQLAVDGVEGRDGAAGRGARAVEDRADACG